MVVDLAFSIERNADSAQRHIFGQNSKPVFTYPFYDVWMETMSSNTQRSANVTLVFSSSFCTVNSTSTILKERN